MTEQPKVNPQITDLQKIILEILLEAKDNQMKFDDLVKEAIKRQERINQLGDIQ